MIVLQSTESVLQTGMAKPPTSVRSIRLPDETWERLATEADKRGVKVNGLVADLVEVGLLRASDPDIRRVRSDADAARTGVSDLQWLRAAQHR